MLILSACSNERTCKKRDIDTILKDLNSTLDIDVLDIYKMYGNKYTNKAITYLKFCDTTNAINTLERYIANTSLDTPNPYPSNKIEHYNFYDPKHYACELLIAIYDNNGYNSLVEHYRTKASEYPDGRWCGNAPRMVLTFNGKHLYY